MNGRRTYRREKLNQTALCHPHLVVLSVMLIRLTKARDIPKDYNAPPIELIDDEDSVKIKKEMLTVIKEWDDPALNLHDKDLKFLNKPDFVKFVSFYYPFRKAAMDCIMKPFLKKCLPNYGASTDTVTALMNCITLNQNTYKNCSAIAEKLIVGCPLGTRNCPYTRQIDNKYCKYLPHTMHWANVKIPGNP
eukprot:10186559-Ditylum_brightwellii.AAC.1